MSHSTLDLPGIKGVHIDEAKLRAHVMRPAHITQARGDRGPQSPGAPLAPKDTGAQRRMLTHLDVSGFQTNMDEMLAASAGYCWQLRQHGVVIAEQNYRFSQTYDIFGFELNIPWTSDTPMHVGSLSKTITAMAMYKLLTNLGITFDTPIGPYLPAYWTQGTDVNLITFANLLTHTSGIASGNTDYESMKTAIAAGVTTYGTYQYSNMNFSLCRILLAVLNGNISVDSTFGAIFTGFIDPLWDLVTIDAFQSYVATNVFEPSGVTAHLVHQPGDALAYTYPANLTGWSDGDLTFLSGAGGWHMTANQYLDVMGAFRRGGTILTTSQAETMLEDSYGIDWTTDTTAGASYFAKNGDWPGPDGELEQTVAFFLPEDMELVVLVNSPVCWRYSPSQTYWVPMFLYSVVSDVYLANLV
jgi:CubicO group peptidase (beta-lactamase class C family)